MEIRTDVRRHAHRQFEVFCSLNRQVTDSHNINILPEVLRLVGKLNMFAENKQKGKKFTSGNLIILLQPPYQHLH